ncbi:MAG TPA: STAS domain-containing protein [Oscillatoriaceae cyanobacterium]
MDSSASSWSQKSPLGQSSSLWESFRAAWGQTQRVETVDGSQRVLRVFGALDKRLAPGLKEQAKAFTESDGGAWAIDLSHVTSWDAEGLSALVYALDLSELADKALILLDPPAALRLTFEQSQLHRLFPIQQHDA